MITFEGCAYGTESGKGLAKECYAVHPDTVSQIIHYKKIPKLSAIILAPDQAPLLVDRKTGERIQSEVTAHVQQTELIQALRSLAVKSSRTTSPISYDI